MKKQIRYADLGFVSRGHGALVIPVDHPNPTLNGTWVRTSRVLKVTPTVIGPRFETEYSEYSPVDQEPMPMMSIEGKLNV